jgi:hypothetical protein
MEAPGSSTICKLQNCIFFRSKWTEFLLYIAYFWASRPPQKGKPCCTLHILSHIWPNFVDLPGDRLIIGFRAGWNRSWRLTYIHQVHGTIFPLLDVERVREACHTHLAFSPNSQVLDDGESDDANDDDEPPLFSCSWRGKHDLYTHASAHHLLYNLGKNAFVGENKNNLSLDTRSTARWLSFTDSKDVRKVMTKLTIKVRGGMMAKAWWAYIWAYTFGPRV